jgi:hypothetical protein
MNMQNLLKNPLVWILGGALITSWLFGSLHAFQAHGTTSAAISLLVPPYGVYMALEQEIGHERQSPEEMMAPNRERDIAALAKRCSDQTEARERSGLSQDAYDMWCMCTFRMAMDNLPEGENEYVAQNGRNSPQFAPILAQAQNSCFSSAHYLGAPNDGDAEAVSP